MKFDQAALTRLREHAGLTRQELADQASVSARTIRRLENSPGGDPKIRTVIGLAKALKVPTDDLFTER